MRKELESMKNSTAKSQMVVEDSDETVSDYSDTVARSATTGTTITSKRWNCDSGTSSSLTTPSFHLKSSSAGSLLVRTANNGIMKSSVKGKITSPIPGNPDMIVHQIDNLAESLLSIAEVTDANTGVVFTRDKVLFVRDDLNLTSVVKANCAILTEGVRDGRSYYVDEVPSVSSFRVAQSSKACLLTWHHRLAHLGLRGLQDLRRRGDIEVSINNKEEVMRCEECVKGKLNRLNLQSRLDYKVTSPLSRVHSDLCQLPYKSRSNFTYIMTFVDEATHFAMIYFLKTKDQALECFKRYVKRAERDTGETLKCIRTDNGGEYTSASWEKFCLDQGIHHSMGPPYSPQLNGVAERYNRTLLNKILPNRFKSGLPVRFWEDATRHAVLSTNLSPSRSIPSNSSPSGLWKKLDVVKYTRLRAFGCKAWRMLTGPQRHDKLSPKSRSCLHLYSLPDGDGWMLWDLVSQKAVKSRDVIFEENLFLGLGSPGRRTREEWDEWEVKLSRDRTKSDGRTRESILTSPTPPCSPLDIHLDDHMERGLEMSIHNPSNRRTDTQSVELPEAAMDDAVSESEESATPTSPPPTSTSITDSTFA